MEDSEDAPAFSRRRKRDTGDLDITPMIDVTFLLLIFFMVTSTMKPPVDADVPPARYGVGEDAAEAIVISLIGGADAAAEPLVKLPGEAAVPLSDVRSSDAVFKLVAATVAETPARNRVLLNADRDLPHGPVREVSQMIGKVEGVRLFLGVQDR